MKYYKLGTQTSRYSSKEPNTANMPRDMRKVYKAKNAYFGCDYTNYELTLLKSLSAFEKSALKITELLVDLEKRISALEKQLNVKDIRVMKEPISIIHDEVIVNVMHDEAQFDMSHMQIGRLSSSDPGLQNIPIKFTPTCQCQMKILMSNGCQCGGA